ncbi:LCP family protein required for cell wall assembly [Evansella vedderi]|uniref:Polyisoprenyl-teichoic acid--peptidoglycan teichoic acid transferase TagU n=1 Tax=Evansella vedderi TaxID=38282 RepID=A0ABT9ZT87_9BACI|nr:LCP family protein [Evansella vedderi]MDQ0254451.1 LCP family protein required for cell wall assembly [Evansella vedderi]
MTKKKVFITIGLSFFTVMLAIGAYGFYIYKNVEDTVRTMHVTIEREKSEKREIVVDISQKDPLSFLLMGVDTDGTERGRTDTLMVITVNPNEESMKMVSIPRDTYTEIVGRGTHDKINHAYAFGGPDMAIRTVENYLNIPIDYFATVNMAGFKDIVDALGGVTVNNDFAFRQSGHRFEEGEIFLNGDQALAYARMRKSDSRGDLGRNDRQRQIVSAIIEEGAQVSSVTRTGEILSSLENNITTNLEFSDIMQITQNYHTARKNATTLEFSGRGGGRQNGIWYLFVPEEERLDVSNQLRAHLGLDADSTSVAKADDNDDE